MKKRKINKSKKAKAKAQPKAKLQYVNMNKGPDGKYFVGYRKGKTFLEQQERYSTPEEALKALNLKPDAK